MRERLKRIAYNIWWHGIWYVIGTVFLIVMLPTWLPIMAAGLVFRKWNEWRYWS